LGQTTHRAAESIALRPNRRGERLSVLRRVLSLVEHDNFGLALFETLAHGCHDEIIYPAKRHDLATERGPRCLD